MVSDDDMDSDGPDAVPAKGKIPTKAEEAAAAAEEEDDDDEEDGEEFRVEKILKHDFSPEGVTIYQIKWLGYEKKADLTWEPIENLCATYTPFSQIVL
jgi:chromobox protein 1